MERKKPQLIRARNAETGELFTVRGDELRNAPEPLRKALPADLEALARSLWERIGKELFRSYDHWIDGFLKDRNPDHELESWRHICDVVDDLGDNPSMKSLKRLDLIRAVIAQSVGVVDIPSQIKGVSDSMVVQIRQRWEELP